LGSNGYQIDFESGGRAKTSTTWNNQNAVRVADTIEFENTLNKRIEVLKLKLKESNNHRECDVLITEIDTLESVLGRLSDLKHGDKELWKKYRTC
jgi:hypothetical protein